MTERELKRLRRADLLEILLELSQENEQLKKDLADAQAQLEDRRIRLEEAGSIAEAALELNGVFEAAQKACQEYLDNIREKSRLADEYREELMRRLSDRCGNCQNWRGLFDPEKLPRAEEETQ